jgi:ParB-like chromosome segregation protein Spo0J
VRKTKSQTQSIESHNALEPLSRIEWRRADGLRSNDYNPNVVFTPELRLLELSILRHGWIQPVVIREDGTIIDGFHRWALSRDSKALRAKYGGQLPCVVFKLSDEDAMLLTIRMNRAKGTHVALRMAHLVKRLVDGCGADPDYIAREIGAPRAEVDLLYQDNLFKARKLDQAPYSEAWAPAESRTEKKAQRDYCAENR